MYLSRLTLDPQHPQARRDLGDAYNMHRTLARVFAADASTPVPRFLWRLESSFDGAATASLLVQSDTLANWSALDNLPGYALQVQGNKVVNLNQLIHIERRFRYRLLANPTVTRNGKRYGLYQEADQLAWLARQGAKNGFTLLSCLRTSHSRLNTHKNKTADRITLQTVLFEGVLQATDAPALQQLLRQGLGHGKALGLGLLSLAPLA